ncbi:MAG: glycosyltransferase family 2 protein [Sulfuricaulis sp.]|uniref:glycosyltransferase family 2 protein n=1 Tax=Sulfuricaulis sp. TaxID=2003553 RepID=UPI0034A32E02
MHNAAPKLSLVIPCYNEAANLPLLLPKCAKLAEPGKIEVLLVDNGSIDGTSSILAELLPFCSGCRSVRVENNQGYGFGILSGLRAAKGQLLGWTHADLQTDPVDARRGLSMFEIHGADIFVKGRRYGRPLGDTLFSVGMSAFETLLLNRPLWDINAQPTLFSRAFFESWHEPPHDFSLDLYAYFQAKRAGLPVHRFPVRFGVRVYGASHWNLNWAEKRKFIRRAVSFGLQLRKSTKQ